MIELKFFDNFGQAMQVYGELGDRLAPEMSMALNRAAVGIKTDVTRQVATTRQIKRAELRDWKIHKSSPADLRTESILGGKRLGLEKFKPRPSGVMTGRTSGGVTVNLGGKTVQFRHAFTGQIWDAAPKVFERNRDKRPKQDYYLKAGKKKRLIGRFPLSRLAFITVPQMADDDDVVEVVIAKAEERFLAQFDHVVNRLVERFA